MHYDSESLWETAQFASVGDLISFKVAFLNSDCKYVVLGFLLLNFFSVSVYKRMHGFRNHNIFLMLKIFRMKTISIVCNSFDLK